MREYIDNGIWTIYLEGRVDSTNAQEIEESFSNPDTVSELIFDAEKLDYISSAGLRIILRMLKRYKNVSIINASSEVYEILDMTGFTEMLKVRKAYRQINLDGCEIVGKGSNGTVYRSDAETVVKVYKNQDALHEIEHERTTARKALILGIPTAISYDIVKAGDRYASVFELLNRDSVEKKLAKDPSHIEEPVDIYVNLLKSIHEITDQDDDFPSVKQTALKWTKFLKDYLPSETYEKLLKIVSDVEEDNHLVHGDYHPGNVHLEDGKPLLIDMDTLSHGHYMFEFATMFLGFVGFYELAPEECVEFHGYTAETSKKFWQLTLAKYFNTNDPVKLKEIEEKASIVGYIRLMRRTIRRIGEDDPKGKAQIDLCKSRLIDLANRYDTMIYEV